MGLSSWVLQHTQQSGLHERNADRGLATFEAVKMRPNNSKQGIVRREIRLAAQKWVESVTTAHNRCYRFTPT